eukprot:3202219-Rhodomonas_salina.1
MLRCSACKFDAWLSAPCSARILAERRRLCATQVKITDLGCAVEKPAGGAWADVMRGSAGTCGHQVRAA